MLEKSSKDSTTGLHVPLGHVCKWQGEEEGSSRTGFCLGGFPCRWVVRVDEHIDLMIITFTHTHTLAQPYVLAGNLGVMMSWSSSLLTRAPGIMSGLLLCRHVYAAWMMALEVVWPRGRFSSLRQRG